MIKHIALIKKILSYSFLLASIGILSIFLIDGLVSRKAESKMFSTTDLIPHNKVGLLLGTGKYLQSGYENLYYRYRIQATYELFVADKIDYVLVSGDNSEKDYDEPTDMKNDLKALGIPEEKIFLDYAGFRTLDSVVRCKQVFGENKITIISQPFHNERALYIAQNKGLNAVAFNAKEVSKKYGIKTRQREKLARVKMFLDLFINKQPKFLGAKIEIK